MTKPPGLSFPTRPDGFGTNLSCRKQRRLPFRRHLTYKSVCSRGGPVPEHQSPGRYVQDDRPGRLFSGYGSGIRRIRLRINGDVLEAGFMKYSLELSSRDICIMLAGKQPK